MAKYCLALGLVIFAAYSNSFTADFVIDSAILIKQDPRVHAATAENVDNILHHGYWWPAYESNLYRPVTTLSYLANYAILDNRESPTGYHVVNLLLHWLNACLVLVIVRQLSRRLDIAVTAAALFALHPINTEAVTYLVGRADLLATVSILLGGWCYLNAAETDGGRRAGWLIGLAASAAWGVFAKETGVMIVVFIALYDWLWRWPRRTSLASLVSSYIALVPALGAFMIARGQLPLSTSVLSQIFVDNPILGATSFLQAKMTAISVIGRDLWLLIWPATLSNDYSFSQIPLFGAGTTIDTALALVSFAVVVAALIASFWQRHRFPLVTWGVWFFVLMMLPTSNLIITIGSIMAERFLYLPAIGLFTVAAAAVWSLGKRRQSISVAVCAVTLIALGIRTYARNVDWQTDRTIWASALDTAANSFKTYKGNATAIWANGAGTGERELDQAITMAERGAAILEKASLPLAQQDAGMFLDLGQYYRLKGEALAQRGRLDEASPYFQKAISALVRARTVDRWTNEEARRSAMAHGTPAGAVRDEGNFNIYVQLAAAELDAHNWADAESAARYAMHLQPLNAPAYQLAGMARFNQGQPYDAGVLFTAITLVQPRDGQAWNALIAVCQQLGLTSSPVIQTREGSTLDDRVPIVRRMINDAAVTIVRQLDDAKQPEAARRYEQDFTSRMHVPVEMFKAR